MTKTYKLYVGTISSIMLLLLMLRMTDSLDGQIPDLARHLAACFTMLLALMTVSSRDIVKRKLQWSIFIAAAATGVCLAVV